MTLAERLATATPCRATLSRTKRTPCLLMGGHTGSHVNGALHWTDYQPRWLDRLVARDDTWRGAA